MPAYQKICIICSKSFYTQRLNTLYCGRQCRNRARYLPPNLLAALARRNSQFAINATANRYSQMMIEDNGALNPQAYNKDAFTDNEVELYKKSILLGLDPKVRPPQDNNRTEEIRVKRDDNQVKIIPVDVPVDHEAVNLKLDYHENRKIGSIEAVIDFDNSLPDPDDDGLGVVNEIAKQQQQAKPTFGVDHKDIDKQNDKVNLSSVVPQTNENDLSLSNIRRGIRKLGGSK